MTATKAIGMQNDLAGFSSDEEEDTHRPWRGSSRLVTPRKRVGSQKRNHAHMSRPDSLSSIPSTKQRALAWKKARSKRRSNSPRPRATSGRRISYRGHTSSLAASVAMNSSATPSQAIGKKRSHKHRLEPQQELPNSPMSQTSFSLPHLERQTSLQAVTGVPQNESMGESSATTTSNSNCNKYMASNNTGTTVTTEITSNVHLKRKADVGGEGTQSMIFDEDDYLCDDDDDDDDKQDAATVDLSRRPASFLSSHLARRKDANSRKRHKLTAKLHSPATRTFIMDMETPVFALVEGMQPVALQEQHRNVILQGQGRQEQTMPQAGRVLELPAEALHGLWTADLRKTSSGTSLSQSQDSMSPDEIASLDTSTISLRHNTRANLPLLRSYHHHQQQSRRNTAALPPPSANTAMSLAAGPMDPDTVIVSVIHPQWTRQSQMDLQHVATAIDGSLSKSSTSSSKGDNDQGYFIASVSIAGFFGFDCSGDLNVNAAKFSSTLLEGVEEERLSNSQSRQATCPTLLSIAGATRAIGVSVLCDLTMGADYVVWICQDLTLPKCPIVAIDVTFMNPTSSTTLHPDQQTGRISASPSSSMNVCNGMEEDEDNEPLQKLSELNLRAHMQSVGRTTYDPIQRFSRDYTLAPKTSLRQSPDDVGDNQRNGILLRSDVLPSEPGRTMNTVRRNIATALRGPPRKSIATKVPPAGTSAPIPIPRDPHPTVLPTSETSAPSTKLLVSSPLPDINSPNSLCPLLSFSAVTNQHNSSFPTTVHRNQTQKHDEKPVSDGSRGGFDHDGNGTRRFERHLKAAASNFDEEQGRNTAALSIRNQGETSGRANTKKGLLYSAPTNLRNEANSLYRPIFPASSEKSSDKHRRRKQSVADFFREQQPARVSTERENTRTQKARQSRSQSHCFRGVSEASHSSGLNRPLEGTYATNLAIRPTEQALSSGSKRVYRATRIRSALSTLLLTGWCLLTWKTELGPSSVVDTLSAMNTRSWDHSRHFPPRTLKSKAPGQFYEFFVRNETGLP